MGVAGRMVGVGGGSGVADGSAGAVAVGGTGLAVAAPPGIPVGAGKKPLEQIKVVRPTDEEIAKGIPEVKEQFRDTFGI